MEYFVEIRLPIYRIEKLSAAQVEALAYDLAWRKVIGAAPEAARAPLVGARIVSFEWRQSDTYPFPSTDKVCRFTFDLSFENRATFAATFTVEKDTTKYE